MYCVYTFYTECCNLTIILNVALLAKSVERTFIEADLGQIQYRRRITSGGEWLTIAKKRQLGDYTYNYPNLIDHMTPVTSLR